VDPDQPRVFIKGQDQTEFLTECIKAGAPLRAIGNALGVSREWVRMCAATIGLRSRARQLGRVRRLHQRYLERGLRPAQQVVADWCNAHRIAVKIVVTQGQATYCTGVLHVGPTEVAICCHATGAAYQFSAWGRYFRSGHCYRRPAYVCYVVSPDRIFCVPHWVVRQYGTSLYFPENHDGIWEWARIERSFLMDPAMAHQSVQAAALKLAAQRWRLARRKTQCPRGHVYTSESVYVTPSGDRGCRPCRTLASTRSRQRHRVATKGP